MDEKLKQPVNVWQANPWLKMFLFVFIVVFLFSGIGLVVFSVWSKQYRQKVYEETQKSLPKHQVNEPNFQGWKTYKNDQYGFEMIYPQDWVAEEYDPVKNNEVDSDTGNVIWVNFIQNKEIMFSVEVLTKQDLDLYKGYNNSSTIEFGVDKSKSPIYYRTKQSRTDFECYGVNSLRGFCTEQFSIQTKNAGYWLIIDGRLVDGSITSIYSQIISTFKLTKPADFSNWKTYKNEKFGLEFMYPPNGILKEYDLTDQEPNGDAPFCPNGKGLSGCLDLKIEFPDGSKFYYVFQTHEMEQLVLSENVRSDIVNLGGKEYEMLVDDHQNAILNIDKETSILFSSGIEGLSLFSKIIATFKFTK